MLVLSGNTNAEAAEAAEANERPQVRKTPSWPRSWASFSLLQLHSHRNAWANSHLLGQPNTFLALALALALDRIPLGAAVPCLGRCTSRR